MDTDKEIAAFVDWMDQRLLDGPAASKRGRHRAAFIALRGLVGAALARGHTLKATWEALRDKGKLSMTYETFRSYCRRAGLGQSALREVPPAAQSARQPAATTSAGPRMAPDASRPLGFHHTRVPRKKDIYG